MGPMPLIDNLPCPSPSDFLYLDEDIQADLDSVKFVSSPPIHEQDSVFQGHTTPVKSLQDVQLVYRHLFQLHPNAHHVMATFHSYDEAMDAVTLGLADDGEYGAGGRLLHTLVDTKHNFTAVFVTRSGACRQKLEPLHFHHILHAASDVVYAMPDEGLVCLPHPTIAPPLLEGEE